MQASERPKLFDPKTMKLLAKLKAGDPQRYEELLEAWKGNKLSGVAKIDAEVEKIVKRGRKAKGGDGDGPGAVLRRIIDSAELWHDQYREPYATVTVTAKDGSVHREHLAVGGQAFRLWVQHEFWRATKSVPKKELLNGWVDTARGQGLFDGEEHRTYVRVAALEDRVYVDLTDAAWQAVEIDKTGWRIITDPPVRFRRAGGEQPLPTPVRSTSDIEDMLGTLVKVRKPEQLKLVLGHMVACLGLDGPIPMLCFVCEYGSLKTSTMRVVRTHVDPRTPMTSGLSKSEDDMLVAGKAQWLLAFDNLSEIPDDMADVLCRVVTGGGSYKRKLFTDADLSALDIRRPVLLTATQMPSNRPDFIRPDHCHRPDSGRQGRPPHRAQGQEHAGYSEAGVDGEAAGWRQLRTETIRRDRGETRRQDGTHERFLRMEQVGRRGVRLAGWGVPGELFGHAEGAADGGR